MLFLRWGCKKTARIKNDCKKSEKDMLAVVFTDSIQEKYLYLNKKYPKYVWVCELSPLSMYKNDMAVGEVILDATSYANDFIESIISVRFGQYEAYHSLLNEDWFSEFNTNAEWSYKFPLFKGI